jgi:hypothetical protein
MPPPLSGYPHAGGVTGYGDPPPPIMRPPPQYPGAGAPDMAPPPYDRAGYGQGFAPRGYAPPAHPHAVPYSPAAAAGAVPLSMDPRDGGGYHHQPQQQQQPQQHFFDPRDPRDQQHLHDPRDPRGSAGDPRNQFGGGASAPAASSSSMGMYSVASPQPAAPTAGRPPPAAVNTASLLDLVSMVDTDDEHEARAAASRREADARRAAASGNLPVSGEINNEPPPRDLPPGWVAHMSKSRNTWFYFNEKTGKTTWTKPTS